MTLATDEDVETAIGRPLEVTERQQVNWWLRGIEMLIKARLGDLSNLDQDAVIYVEAEATASKLRRHGNQETSVTVSVDDASVTRRYESRVVEEDISDQLWALITPVSSTSAFTIRTPSQYSALPVRRWW